MQAGEGGAHGDDARITPAHPAPLPRRSAEEAREREGRARRLSAELESAELLAGDAPGRFLVVAAGRARYGRGAALRQWWRRVGALPGGGRGRGRGARYSRGAALRGQR